MSGNTTPALVRTGTPMAAGSALVFIAQAFGLELTVDQALILAPVVMWLYYVMGRVLERVNPKLGYILGIAKTPAYSQQSAPSPGEGETVQAVVVPEEPESSPQPVDGPVEDDAHLFEDDSALAEEPPVVEVHDHATTSRGDVDPALLSHGPETLAVAKPAKVPSKRAQTVSQRVQKPPAKVTPISELKAEAVKKAPAKRAPRKKPLE